METLFQHLIRIIQTDKKDDASASESEALKEIVLSGLSRGGFLKIWSYLPEFDHFVRNELFLCFLGSEDPFSSAEKYINAVKTELFAAGLDNGSERIERGFKIKTDSLTIKLLIFTLDLGEDPVISYRQIPLPYELRSIISVPDNVRSEIRRLIEKEIRRESSPEKKSRRSNKKAGSANKDERNDVMQLSLFDL